MNPRSPGRRDLETPRAARRACLAVLVVGVAARLWGYFTSGSLWLDELFLVDNLRNLGFRELLGTLEHGQNAPVGWLWLSKLWLLVAGDSERALRFPSLMVSLSSLPLMLFVARRVVGPRYAIVPMVLVSLSPFVLWQGLQVKQYATDLFVSLACLALALAAERRGSRGLWLLVPAGWCALWLSMPAVFTLAAVVVGLAAREWCSPQRSQSRLGAIAAMALLWGATFAVNYFTFLQPGRQPEWLYEYWAAGLLAQPVEGATILPWLHGIVASAYEVPVGFVEIGRIAMWPAVLGLIAWPLLRAGRRFASGLVALPALLTLVAAALRQYPFADRLVLFLVPNLATLFAAGVRALGGNRAWRRSAVAALTSLLLAVPVAALLVWLPRGGLPIAADTEALFARLGEEMEEGELLVLDHVTSYAWRYYGDADLRGAIVVPASWTDGERARQLRRTLVGVARSGHGEGGVWVAVARVTDEPLLSLRDSFQRDVASRRYTLPATYAWLVAEQTRWASVERFRRAVPAEWTVEREIREYGCAAWRLVPAGEVRR